MEQGDFFCYDCKRSYDSLDAMAADHKESCIKRETSKEIIDRLTAQSKPSGWLEKAKWRQENRYWTRVTQLIAVRILTVRREKDWTYQELAARSGVSMRKLKKIVKGSYNADIMTICKLEQALGTVLLEVPKVQKPLESDD